MTNSLTTTLKYMFIQSISKHLLSLFQALTLKLGSMMKPANNLALKHIVKQRKSQGVECTESTRIGHVKWTASFLTFYSPALGNMCFDRYGKGWLKSLNSHLGWHVFDQHGPTLHEESKIALIFPFVQRGMGIKIR